MGEDLRRVKRELARDALQGTTIKRLMTVPGIDMVVAIGLGAAIGPITRFKGPDQLVSYIGLNPSVHQSGEGRPQHGRITKQGRTHARTMLGEAAWQAVRGPGPLRAFYERIARRRGNNIAAVAVARKLAVIVWHLLTKDEDYAGSGLPYMPRNCATSSCARACLPGGDSASRDTSTTSPEPG